MRLFENNIPTHPFTFTNYHGRCKTLFNLLSDSDSGDAEYTRLLERFSRFSKFIIKTNLCRYLARVYDRYRVPMSIDKVN